LHLRPARGRSKDAGSIVGTVRDATGAVIPGAKVNVMDVDKRAAFVISTSSSGDYVASPLRIGRHYVSIEKEGFNTAVTDAVELQVQQRAAVDTTLQFGQVVEWVTIHDVAPLLDTETSELGQVVDTRNMANLPLNGRNSAQLAQLSAGVVPSESGARNSATCGCGSNGGRSCQNKFLLDGVDKNSNLTDLLNSTSYVIPAFGTLCRSSRFKPMPPREAYS